MLIAPIKIVVSWTEHKTRLKKYWKRLEKKDPSYTK